MSPFSPGTYRGRIAPSPTGLLHLGHARTFWAAWKRAREAHGQVVLRNEDLDPQRSKPEFVRAFMEDLRWLGLDWDEGPDIGGPYKPYNQSERAPLHREALQRLIELGHAYPCYCSRKEVQLAARAPHADDEEPIYAGTCRPSTGGQKEPDKTAGKRPCWRFRVLDGERICFGDGYFGPREYIAGRDFGDFVIWRPDDVPAYQLAVVVDDALMHITEVVRGADLLLSTARQILLYRALGWDPPAFFHCPLVTDEAGVRLAKRNDALSLGTLRAQGCDPGALKRRWSAEMANPSGESAGEVKPSLET